MELSYTVTEREYVEAIARRPENQAGARSVKLGVCVCLMVMVSILCTVMMNRLSGGHGWDDIWPAAFCAGVFGVAILVLLLLHFPRPKLRRKIRRQMKLGVMPVDFFGPHRLVLEAGTIELTRGSTRVRLPCRGLHGEDVLGGVVLYAGATVVEFVPNTAFTGAGEKQRLRQEIAASVQRLQDDPVEEAVFAFRFIWNQEGFVRAVMEGYRMLASGRDYWTLGRILGTIFTSGMGLWFIGRSIVQILWQQMGVLSAWVTMMIGVFLAVLPNVRALLALPLFSRALIHTQIKNHVIPQENFEQQCCAIGADGVAIQTMTLCKNYLWPQITHCAYRKNALVLLIEGKLIYPLPDSAFQSEDERVAAEAYIRSHAHI